MCRVNKTFVLLSSFGSCKMQIKWMAVFDNTSTFDTVE